MSEASDKLIGFVKRNPIGVSCAIISFALVATLYFRWGKIDSAQTLRDEKDAQSQKLTQNKENAFDLTEQLNRLVDDNKAIETRLLSLSQGGASYVQYFHRLGTDVPGVKVLEANPQGSSKAALGPASFSLTVQGTYNQLMNVLRRLESGPYFCRILNLTLAGAGSVDGGDQLTMRLSLELLGQQ